MADGHAEVHAKGHAEAGAAAVRAGASEPLPQFLLGLLQALPALVSDRVELLSLELRRAGDALATITLLVVAATILGMTAWFGLWALLVGVLIAAGVQSMPALLLAIGVNLGVALLALLLARSKVRLLGLPATRRHLTVRAPHAPPPHEDSHAV